MPLVDGSVASVLKLLLFLRQSIWCRLSNHILFCKINSFEGVPLYLQREPRTEAGLRILKYTSMNSSLTVGLLLLLMFD